MKRFYKDVSVTAGEAGFDVLLDGKPLATPAKHPLHLPTQKLAEAIAEEWRAQGKDILPATMPLMQLAATALDQLPRQREVLMQRMLAYIDNDLLCLREDKPGELRNLQDSQWHKPLEWLSKTHGIVMKVSEGLKAPQQPEFTHRAFKKYIEALDDFSFIGMSEAVSVSGSLVLALALYENAFTAEQVFEFAELETLYQARRWGEDEEAKHRHAAIHKDLVSLALWFELIRQEFQA